ncbi:cold-shock protein [Desulfonema ishimotonii]|uniref:Cold-shock protein n=2 Tax=Desulfonema ishimotonii TaxID=45657 RepID=A0A401FUW7_9BACT|nr:cold shock domain-containing protein [Desulfonema ishimotonii]GBC60743.1 cold-shock protein [Desulfonema ishimotonii]
MMIGRVKWFNKDKGYGFIETETYQHVFVHYTCIENGCGIQGLQENEQVMIDEIRRSVQGLQATQVRRVKMRA